ncbi:MAG TPA: YigZ family protein, partial [Thermoanaerobaculia bacterium]|nr:YigZ family protein [Thermoanaerobaculia bacterium]
MRKPSPDERSVPERPGRGEVRERASRFLAFAHRVSTPDEAAAIIEGLRREYHDATHVAFAWRTGSGPSAAERSSDAGEPSGTAGKPIAGAISSARLSDVVVAVV